MATAMESPRPPSPYASVPATTNQPISSESVEPETSTTTTKQSMGPPSLLPPPPPNPSLPAAPQNPDEASPHLSSDTTIGESTDACKDKMSEGKKSKSGNNNNVAVPYQIPPWSEPPSQPFFLEVLKDGSIVGQFDLTKKGAYMFGRIDLCDFVLEHPTISRFHAVLQFRGSGDAFLYDLGSTHGTFINKKQVNKKVYVDLHVGDVIRFGHSTQLYIFQGPEELMLPEADLASSYAKDREASLRRARENAALADGVTWGMQEDALEEAEEDTEELTWQTYKGELTEKQQKTREKILKRMEKIAHMKKEMGAIRAKDISQGGLTQGQQTQIARNELRISQIFEELESLEETLNDSIRESLGARSRKSSHNRQKGLAEDEDELLSDEDEFYDRTKKKPVGKSADTQAVETVDSLLDKKEALMEEMEDRRRLILEEKNKMSEPKAEQEAGDVLDAFMTGLSSQLVLDKTVQLEKDISSLQTELDRIVYLLKIADPTGEIATKRAKMANDEKCKDSALNSSVVKRPENPKIEKKNASQPEKPKSEKNIVCQADKPVASSGPEQVAPVVVEEMMLEETSEAQKSSSDATELTESKPSTYIVAKPQWLGAVENREQKECQSKKPVGSDEDDEFVDYRDRNKILESDNSQTGTNPETELEKATPGLILRKKKSAEAAENSEDRLSESSAAKPGDMMAEDAVALLLKHKRGLYAADEEAGLDNVDKSDQEQSGQENKRAKRVLGPKKPAFSRSKSDYETWVPPKGQSGDGRTSLNDRLGY